MSPPPDDPSAPVKIERPGPAPGFGQRPASPGGAPPPGKRPRKKRPRLLAAVLTTPFVLVALAGLAVIWFQATYLADLPPTPSGEALWAVRRSPGMTFLDRTGAIIATRGAKYGRRVTLAELPAYAPKAFLAAEDRRFYKHGPIDLYAIARAVQADLKAHRAAQGGSTLSQQLARTLFLKRDHSLKRKVQEAVLAWRLEQMMSKDQVLELYMNRTYFGAGAYGVDAAARTYFGKPASRLTLAEAALLAALPNAPSRLALTNDMPAALARSRWVLSVMRQEGWITAGQEQAAADSPPTLAAADTGEGSYSYILDQAAAQAAQLSGGATPDLVVRLTIDERLQAAAVQAVNDVVRTAGRGRGVSQGAFVALAPDGAIVAMVGGLDHDKSAFNRAVQARRQPGSSFKAFVYGAAMEHGVTPDDIRVDSPVSLGNWTPENYGKHYSGPVTVEQALARSINTISVKLTEEVGPDAVAEFARRCGLVDIPAHPGPSIALGAYEVSLLELAGGYQVFQTGGGRTTPHLVMTVSSTGGQVLWAETASALPPVMDPLYATRMVRMMKTVITAGTGTHANIGRPAAGKTGTSQNWRDAWFIGFTPDLLAAAWVGNDDNRSMAKVTGGELPAEIWRRFMVIAEKDVPPTDFPWLVAEPPHEPSQGPPSEDQGPYQDMPYQDMPPTTAGADDGPDSDKITPPPSDDDPSVADRSDVPDPYAPPPPPTRAPRASRAPPEGDERDSGPPPARGGPYYDARPERDADPEMPPDAPPDRRYRY